MRFYPRDIYLNIYDMMKQIPNISNISNISKESSVYDYLVDIKTILTSSNLSGDGVIENIFLQYSLLNINLMSPERAKQYYSNVSFYDYLNGDNRSYKVKNGILYQSSLLLANDPIIASSYSFCSTFFKYILSSNLTTTLTYPTANIFIDNWIELLKKKNIILVNDEIVKINYDNENKNISCLIGKNNIYKGDYYVIATSFDVINTLVNNNNNLVNDLKWPSQNQNQTRPMFGVQLYIKKSTPKFDLVNKEVTIFPQHPWRIAFANQSSYFNTNAIDKYIQISIVISNLDTGGYYNNRYVKPIYNLTVNEMIHEFKLSFNEAYNIPFESFIGSYVDQTLVIENNKIVNSNTKLFISTVNNIEIKSKIYLKNLIFAGEYVESYDFPTTSMEKACITGKYAYNLIAKDANKNTELVPILVIPYPIFVRLAQFIDSIMYKLYLPSPWNMIYMLLSLFDYLFTFLHLRF